MAQLSFIKHVINRIPLKPIWRFVLIFCLAVGLVLAITQPIKRRAWRVIKNQGDKALINQQYELAKTEYAKLKLIDPKNPEPDQLISFVTEGQENVVLLRQFYLDHGREDIVSNIDKATRMYANEQEATLACQELFKDGQLNLALLCITNTTQKWPTYRDGWLTQTIIAETIGNATKAQEARARALELDPSTASDAQ